MAGDTSVLTAMAVNPQDPFRKFFVGYINEDNQSVIQRTRDGGYYFETKLTLPEHWVITKMFVANDPTATVFAVLGMDRPAFDSVKIIYSKTNGNSWNTAYAAQIDYRFESSAQYLGSYRWLTFSDPNTYVVNLPNGIFKSNNGGMSWYLVPREYQQTSMVQYLTRAPNDTTTFYSSIIPSLVKFSLGSSGSLGAVDISYGLAAFPINKMMFADEQNLIAHITDNTNNNEINVLMFSQNLGLDYEFLQNKTKPVTAFWSNVSDQFVWLEENGTCYVSPDMRVKDSINSVFGMGTGMITKAYSMNYFFELSEDNYTDSTLMIAAGSSGGFNSIWMSLDDGANWANIGSAIFGNQPVKSISAYLFEIGGISRIRILAATENKVYAMLKGVTAWSLIYSAPSGSTITEMSSNFNTALISAVSGPNSSISKLFISRFIPDSLKWEAEDITSSINHLFALYGPGRIVDVNCAEDGNYLILEHSRAGEPTKRKLYKIGYNPQSVRWVEITESPVDAFLFSSIGTNYTYEGNSFNVYASANNGIWQLKQSPIITHDSVSAAPAAEVLTGETDFSVMYHNAGSAFAVIDAFIIQDDPERNFSFADTTDRSDGLFLDIKQGTPLDLVFHPKTIGHKQATLYASLKTPKSVGSGDSTITLKTRLTGNVKFAQLGTGLKGDSLNMGATMIGTTLTKTFTIRNLGTEILDVYDIYLVNAGTYFDLLTDTTEFSLSPGESRPVWIRFDAGSAPALVTAECWIYSTSYNSQNNRPDTLRKISLTARASRMEWIQSGNPTLNQPYSLDVTLADMKNSAATAVLKYWPTGSSSSALKIRPLIQVPFPDNHLHLNVAIPSEDITEKGITFYIEITDSVKIWKYPEDADISPFRLGVRIPSPGLNSGSWVTLPGGASRKAYRMISFPVDLDNNSAQSAFAASHLGELGDKGDWQLYRWDRALNQFISATNSSHSFGNIISGKSYLLITRKAKSLNSGSGISVVPGSAQSLILPGWNMISNPYTFPISWNSVVWENNNRVELRNLVILNNGRFEYVDENALRLFRLDPWKGYFYYSDTSTFIMKFPARDAGLFSKEISENPVPPLFAIQAELLSAQNDRVGIIEFGEHAEALNGLDPLDKPALPAFSGEDIQIRLSGPVGKLLHSDFRRNSESGNSWDFEIIKLERDQSLSLMFNGTENLTDGFMLAVLNRNTGKLEYMTSGADHRVRGSGTGTVQFRAFVGTKDYIESQALNTIPSEFYLAQNYPNPFNPSTTIHYGLPSSSNVELSIYNSLGQKVRTLYSGIQNAGQQRIVWNGRNDNGAPVSSGIYIFRASIRSLEDGGHFRQSRKMMLVK